MPLEQALLTLVGALLGALDAALRAAGLMMMFMLLVFWHWVRRGRR